MLQIVLYRQDEVLDCECDMAMVHHLLSQIPQDLPYETLISRAGDLFVQFPPSELAREAASHEQYIISKPSKYIHIPTKQNVAAAHLTVLVSNNLCFCFCSVKAWQALLLRILTLPLLSNAQTLSFAADADRNRLQWKTRL